MAAYRAFLNPDPGTGGQTFASGRAARYARYWSLYQNTAYDDLSRYVAAYPATHKLYKMTRGLRNPMGAYADFWQANIWGGMLDYDAGDGESKPSALPIETENEALRAAIAQIWQWSNWAQKRSTFTLYGIVCGDAICQVVDSPASQKVYLRVLWPGDVATLEWDDFGNVKKAVIEYDTVDANGLGYKYKEEIEHPSVHQSGQDATRYRTYRNGGLWAYPQNASDGQAVAEWFAPYNFVPVVHAPFTDVGVGWGAVGYQAAVRLIDEACSKASMINDQLGKELNPPLIAYGLQPGDINVTANSDGVPILYVPRAPTEAKLDQLIYDMNIADAMASLAADLDEVKELLPELQFSRDMRSGMSGVALRTAYAPLLAKVQATRTNFDASLVRAQNMAVAIGGIRSYGPEFSPFGAESYGSGALDHSIAGRPVLPRGEDEALAEGVQTWQIITAAVTAGVPLETALVKLAGWSEEDMTKLATQKAAAAKQAAAAAQAQTGGAAPPDSGRAFRISWGGQRPDSTPPGSGRQPAGEQKP